MASIIEEYYVCVSEEELDEIGKRIYVKAEKSAYENMLEAYNDYKENKRVDKQYGINMGVLLKVVSVYDDNTESYYYCKPRKYKNKLIFKSI